MKPNVIIIHPKDNVGVALADIHKDESIVLPDGEAFPALADIGFSHKVLLTNISRGADIIKYGETIAKVGQDLRKGDWVHVHNLNLEGE
ncbi:MAG: UxaA family hydrolase [bacterium]